MHHALRWCTTLLALVHAQEPPCGLANDGACVRPRTNAPSFVVAVADDMGHGDAGYLGGRFPTPELDKLARDAIKLDAFYAASPVCSPTRASLLTGRHAARAGVHDANQGHLPAGEYSLPRALKRLGYATGHFGKWHVGVLSTDDKTAAAGAPRPPLSTSRRPGNAPSTCASRQRRRCRRTSRAACPARRGTRGSGAPRT